MSASSKALATVLAAATVSLVPALPAAAQGVFVPPPGARVDAPLTGARANVAQQLRFYGYGDVDARRLSSSQVSRINLLMHSNFSEGDKRSLIGSALRGPGLLQTAITGSVGVGIRGRN